MRESAVVIRKSKSLMEKCIDPQNPRIIYSAPNLVVAIPWRSIFDSSCDVVEAIGLNDSSELNPTLVDNRNGRNVVDHSGRYCVTCHGPSFKPKWENYAYNYGKTWTSEKTLPLGTDDDNIVIGGEEYQTLKTFVADVQSKGKQGWFGTRLMSFFDEVQILESMNSEFNMLPFSERNLSKVQEAFHKRIDSMNLPFVFNFSKVQNHKSPEPYSRPNMRFGDILGDLNVQRIARKMFERLSPGQILKILNSSSICINRGIGDMKYISLPIRNLLQASNLDETELVLSEKEKIPYYDGNLNASERLTIEILRRLTLAPEVFGLYSAYEEIYEEKNQFISRFGPQYNSNCETLRAALIKRLEKENETP